MTMHSILLMHKPLASFDTSQKMKASNAISVIMKRKGEFHE